VPVIVFAFCYCCFTKVGQLLFCGNKMLFCLFHKNNLPPLFYILSRYSFRLFIFGPTVFKQKKKILQSSCPEVLLSSVNVETKKIAR